MYLILIIITIIIIIIIFLTLALIRNIDWFKLELVLCIWFFFYDFATWNKAFQSNPIQQN